MATTVTDLLQELKCPFILDTEVSNDDDLLEAKGLRMQVLQWIFAIIYPGSDKLYTLQPHIFSTHSSRIEVNEAVKVLTSIAASLGLCNQDDYLLILGESGKQKDVLFWKKLCNVTKIMTSNNAAESFSRSAESTQRLLVSYEEETTFPHKANLFTPVIRKELLLSSTPLRTKETKKSIKKRVRHFDDKETIERLHEQEDRMSEINQLVEEKENDLPRNFLKSYLKSPEHLSRQKSLAIKITDLSQSATAFNEIYEEKFKLANEVLSSSNKQYSAGRLESIVSRANQQTEAFSQLMNHMEEMKECRNAITSALSTTDNSVS